MRHLETALCGLMIATCAASRLSSSRHLFSNPLVDEEHALAIPTVHESAIQARRILRLESIGTLSTIFSTTNHATESRPSDVGGTPIGLMDYFADCEPGTGNPTILAITIATSFKNVDAGSNITLSLRWHPQDHQRRSPASLPRFSLVGHLEDISAAEVKSSLVSACFVKYHPDAKWWLPGNSIHTSKWVRLIVEDIYWIGGFGDRAYIGWIPKQEWQSVTQQEIDRIRLPGEKRISWINWNYLLGSDDQRIIMS